MPPRVPVRFSTLFPAKVISLTLIFPKLTISPFAEILVLNLPLEIKSFISVLVIGFVEAINLFALITPLVPINTPLGLTKKILLLPPFNVPKILEGFFVKSRLR